MAFRIQTDTQTHKHTQTHTYTYTYTYTYTRTRFKSHMTLKCCQINISISLMPKTNANIFILSQMHRKYCHAAARIDCGTQFSFSVYKPSCSLFVPDTSASRGALRYTTPSRCNAYTQLRIYTQKKVTQSLCEP